MNPENIRNIIALAVLILMSGYFSATETAFLSCNKTRLRTMAEKGNKRAALVNKLNESYDRLGIESQYMEIMGNKIPMNTIPITPGRNLAMILEVAAMNNRQKKLGYNAALEFTEQVNQHFDENMGKNG